MVFAQTRAFRWQMAWWLADLWICAAWSFRTMWARLCYFLLVRLQDPFGITLRPLAVQFALNFSERQQASCETACAFLHLIDVQIVPENGPAVASPHARRLLVYFWLCVREQTRQKLAALLNPTTHGRPLVCRMALVRPRGLPAGLVLSLDPVKNVVTTTHLGPGVADPARACVHADRFRLSGADPQNLLSHLMGRRRCPRTAC